MMSCLAEKTGVGEAAGESYCYCGLGIEGGLHHCDDLLLPAIANHISKHQI